ncbi:MAG: sigma-70 family RNA polymerase sigma factor [Planctomycetes bacterium]|nr:sigma-70 family RNA polymerase sigma factor [Planctomycetota bacterium]
MSADFQTFVHDHERMVRALALSWVRSPSAADDVTQEAFVRAWKSWGTLRDSAKAKTWIYTVTRNAAVDWLRREKRHKAEELVDVAAPAIEKKPDDRIDRVVGIVNSLREDYRQLVLLRFVEQMSYAEIAEVLGLTASAVGEKLHRVRKMVTDRMGSLANGGTD